MKKLQCCFLTLLPPPPQVYGDKDTDGFYRGEIRGRMGLIPCNMVSEIRADDDETMEELIKQGFLPLCTPVDRIGTARVIYMHTSCAYWNQTETKK